MITTMAPMMYTIEYMVSPPFDRGECRKDAASQPRHLQVCEKEALARSAASFRKINALSSRLYSPCPSSRGSSQLIPLKPTDGLLQILVAGGGVDGRSRGQLTIGEKIHAKLKWKMCSLTAREKRPRRLAPRRDREPAVSGYDLRPGHQHVKESDWRP